MARGEFEGLSRRLQRNAPDAGRREKEGRPTDVDGPVAADMHDPSVWCLPYSLIVDDRLAGRVEKKLGELDLTVQSATQLGERLTKMTWKGKQRAAEVVEHLYETMRGVDGKLSVDTVMVPTMMPAIGPASDPIAVDPRSLPRLWDAAANKAKIAIVDTGMYDPPGRLAGRAIGIGDPDPINVKPPRTVIDYHGACHGGAIAGIVLSRTGKSVKVYNALVPGQTWMCDSSVLGSLQAAKADGADVINLSWGSYTTACHFPLATNRFVTTNKNILFVAAAGNDGTDQKWFPAALAGRRGVTNVVSVGALDTTNATGPEVAPFSNYGDWVKVYAPGVDVITDYVAGLWFKPAYWPKELFRGAARWSGSSFAAPAALATIVETWNPATHPSPVGWWGQLRKEAPLLFS